MTLTLEQELLLLRQDARIILENQNALCDQQRTMGGLIDVLLETDDEQITQIRRLESEKVRLVQEIERFNGIVLPHARTQSAADGFQQGWHAALTRVQAGDSATELIDLVPNPKTDAERRLESEKAALLAANQELQMALQRIVREYAR